ncbi:MAG TPA: hypothetical protein VFP53_09865 [Sphingomicrobium sp.]|nr:hypothetical protein [Sphingomicrobium sp.]
MSKLPLSFAAAAGVAAVLAFAPAAAQAQSASDVKIAEIIVYGNDPCPRSTADEVVVCARKPEADRYRIPERYRPSGTRQQRQSWAERAKSFEYVGRTGIQSCSAVGPGGSTGCLANMIERAKAEAREAETQAAPPPESSGGF